MPENKPQFKPTFRKCITMDGPAGKVQVAEEEQQLWADRGYKKVSDTAPANEQGGSKPSDNVQSLDTSSAEPADEDTKESKSGNKSTGSKSSK